MKPITTRRLNAASRALYLTPVALAAALASQPAASVTRNWTGGAGGASPFWDLATNWNTGLPVAGDIASLAAFDTTIRTGTWALDSFSGTGTLTMTAGALTVTAASSTGNLVMSGGQLGGSGTVTTGAFTWNGGDLGRSTGFGGTLNVNGAATLNSAQHVLNYGHTLNLKGNSTWGPSGRLYLYGAGAGYGASTVNNFAGKTLRLQGDDSTAYFWIDGPGIFNNDGTVTKTGGNLAYIDATFNNTGTLNVNGGEVRFRGARTVGGTINTLSGTKLRFEGTTLFNPAVTISGNGDVDFAGTSNVLASGTRTFGGTGTKTFEAGSLGGAGTMVFNNLTWLGGTMGNSTSTGGVTTVNGAATLSSAIKYMHYGRTLNLNGDVTWDANGRLYIYGAGAGFGESVVNLAAGKTMTLAGNASSYDMIDGPGTFNNAGTITKGGTGLFYIDANFNNTGTVNVNAGELQFRNTRTLGGALNTAAGSTVRFNGSTTFAPGLTVVGNGDLIFDGSYTILTSGSRSFVGTGVKTLTGGVLGGAGTMTFNNFTWYNGSIGYSGSVGGTTTVTGATTLSSATHYVNYGHTLNLNATTWDAGGALYIYGAGGGYGESVVNLAAGKTLKMAGNVYNYDYIYGPGTFNNAGTITKSGTGLLYIDSKFNNTGTVTVNKGELQFRQERTLGGKVTVGSAATLRLNGSTTLDPGLTLTGAGKLIFDGTYTIQTSGTRTFGGGGTKTLANGTLGGAGTMVFDNLTWVNGTMGIASSIGGVTTVNGKTTLSASTHYLNYGRTLNLNGDVVWDANGGLYLYGAGAGYGESVVNLAAGKTMALAGNASSYDQIYGPGTFNNAGTIAKSGTGTFYIDSKLNNSGTLSATKGTTLIRGTLNNTGTLIANGGRVEVTQTTGLTQWNLSTQTLTGGTYRVTGNQPIAFNLGNVPSTSTPALVKTNQANIYLNGSGARVITTTPDPDVNALTGLATNSGVLSLTGGATLNTTVALRNIGTGTVVVGNGSTLTVGTGVYRQSNTAKTFVGGTLALKTFALDSGILSAGNGVDLIGSGTIAAPTNGTTFGVLATLAQDVGTSAWDTLSFQTGNVVLAGTLAARFDAGAGAGTYRFLTADAGQVFGTFNTITSNLDPGLFSLSVVYGTKFVDLQVTSLAPGGGGFSPIGGGGTLTTPVPEPGTWGLFAGGLALLGWRVRRSAARRGAAHAG